MDGYPCFLADMGQRVVRRSEMRGVKACGGLHYPDPITKCSVHGILARILKPMVTGDRVN